MKTEISFVGLTVPRKNISNFTKAIVIYDEDDKKLMAKLSNGIILKLPNWNKVEGMSIGYSSPLNDFYPNWHERKRNKNTPISHVDKVNRYWWRYKPNMVLYGTVVDNTFIVNNDIKEIDNE